MSDGGLYNGQEFDRNKNLIHRFTERMHDKGSADALLGNARTEIMPNDSGSAKVRVYQDATGLDAIVIEGPGTTNIDLPDMLVGVVVHYNLNKGEGSYNETNNAESTGDHVDLNVALQGSAQSSVQIIPEVIPDITPSSTWGRGVNCTRYFFYMTGPVTTAAILARLAVITGQTVNLLPRWKKKPHTLLLKGQGMSVQVTAKCQQSNFFNATYSSYALNKGKGSSYDGQVSWRVVELPPTIHPLITIANNAMPLTAIAEARATIVGGLNFPPQETVQTGGIPTQVASVTPTTLAATTPTTIPTSGLYLVDSNFDSELEWGRTKVFAEVVDFAQFA